jgi:HPr kinase/phosphorylase
MDAVLLLGSSGSGKSDLLLRLIHEGWRLVADDQVVVTNLTACAPPALAGLIELRGLGIFHLPYLPNARLALAIQLGAPADRLPAPATHTATGLPLVTIDPFTASATARVTLALNAALGLTTPHTGAFAA